MRALSLGELAAEGLEHAWPAKIIGVISGGIFILAQERWVLFMTYSPFRAPGTINLERSLIDLKDYETGSKVILNRNQIIFPEGGLVVEMNGAQVWNGGYGGKISPAQKMSIRERLEEVALVASEQKGEQGLAPALRWLLGKGEAALVGDLTDKILAGLDEMRIAIREKRTDKMIAAVDAIVGCGRGLTPATDDCIAGVLLTLNRWNGFVEDGFNLAAVNEAVVRLAREKTTSLSTTIIHAASLGQGDERILRVLDGMIMGNLEGTTAIQDLIQMGHSSGVDTLVGIALALTA